MQIHVLPTQLDGINRLRDDRLQSFGRDRFLQEVESLPAHRFDRPGNGCMSGYQNDVAIRLGLLRLLENLHPIYFIHHQIGDDDVINVLVQ